MTKFYVQSGTFRRVVAADSSRKAALWAIHEVMQQILPTESQSNNSSSTASLPRLFGHQAAEPTVTVLAAKVRVDERGFDRQDAQALPTMEVFAEWNQMVMTLDRLERMLHGVVTPPQIERARFTDDDFSDDLAA